MLMLPREALTRRVEGHNMLDDTRRCSAMFYLSDEGREISRDEFLRALLDVQGFMLYVGDGCAGYLSSSMVRGGVRSTC